MVSQNNYVQFQNQEFNNQNAFLTNQIGNSQSCTNTPNSEQTQFYLYPISEQKEKTPMNQNSFNDEKKNNNQTPFSNESLINTENINQLQTPPKKLSNNQNPTRNSCVNCVNKCKERILNCIGFCIYIICALGIGFLILWAMDASGLPTGDNSA